MGTSSAGMGVSLNYRDNLVVEGELLPNRPTMLFVLVRPDFDGVIIFDESHAMQNVGGGKGERGDVAPSQQGRAGASPCSMRATWARLKPRKAQAEAGDIVLLFADDSEALTHPYLARAWAKRSADLRVPVPGQSKKVAMMGALDWLGRRLIVIGKSGFRREHIAGLSSRRLAAAGI